MSKTVPELRHTADDFLDAATILGVHAIPLEKQRWATCYQISILAACVTVGFAWQANCLPIRILSTRGQPPMQNPTHEVPTIEVTVRLELRDLVRLSYWMLLRRWVFRLYLALNLLLFGAFALYLILLATGWVEQRFPELLRRLAAAWTSYHARDRLCQCSLDGAQSGASASNALSVLHERD